MTTFPGFYNHNLIGECAKHKGHGWLGCPLCAIEDVERRRKELKEMLNENDFDIDSFIDYKPNFKNMTLYGLKCEREYYYVSAESTNEALEKLKVYTKDLMDRYRKVMQIDIIATSTTDTRFITSHNFLP